MTDFACLEGMTLEEQVEHLKGLIYALEDPRLDCLTPQQRRLVAKLIRANGRCVGHAALQDIACMNQRSDASALNADTVVKVQIHHARNRLAAAGTPMTIKTVWGVGYRAEWAA